LKDSAVPPAIQRLDRSTSGLDIATEKPNEVERAGEGGARVSGNEAEVRFVKARYRRRKKNAHQRFVTCALVNLFVSRRKLLRHQRPA
jgi:hypothetical protein